MQTLRKKKQMRFEEAFSEAPSREEVTTYFLAVLELLKLGQMHAEQTGVYGEIMLIRGRAPFVEFREEPPGGKRRRKKPEETNGAGDEPEAPETPEIETELRLNKGRTEETVGREREGTD